MIGLRAVIRAAAARLLRLFARQTTPRVNLAILPQQSFCPAPLPLEKTILDEDRIIHVFSRDATIAVPRQVYRPTFGGTAEWAHIVTVDRDLAESVISAVFGIVPAAAADTGSKPTLLVHSRPAPLLNLADNHVGRTPSPAADPQVGLLALLSRARQQAEATR